MKIRELFSAVKNNGRNLKNVPIILMLGILLMTFPDSIGSDRSNEDNMEQLQSFSLENEEKRLEGILSSIEGVGKCKVLLSIQNGSESVLAERDGETVVLSNGGKQSIVTVQTKYPEFKGAVVVCGGTSSAAVRHDILASVKAYTGLEVDKITICPIKNG